MRAPRPHTPRQVRVTCTPANQVCRLYKIAWCRCVASAAVQPRRLVVRSTKSPAGAVQSAQWRELDSSSSRATAESPAVIRCARRLSELRSSSVSGGTADGGKEHEGFAPSNSAAGENHLHHGKPSLPSCKIGDMVQVRCICRSPAAQAGRRRRNSPPERSNPLSGENLIYQVRELRRNPLWSCAVPVGSRNFVPRPLAVEPPTGERT